MIYLLDNFNRHCHVRNMGMYRVDIFVGNDRGRRIAELRLTYPDVL